MMPFEDFSLKGISFLPIWGFDLSCAFAYRQKGAFPPFPQTGGIDMEVRQIENFKIPNAVAHEITQE